MCSHRRLPLITEDEARLFIASRKFSPELRAYFEKNHVTIEKYDAIYDAVAELKNETVLLEPGEGKLCPL